MLPKSFSRAAAIGFVMIGSCMSTLASAEGAGAAGGAMMLPGLITSAPTGATFIGSLGSSDYSGQTSSGSSHMKVAIRDDAAFFVATQGEESRPALEEAFERYRQRYPDSGKEKLEIATGILVNDPSMESLY